METRKCTRLCTCGEIIAPRVFRMLESVLKLWYSSAVSSVVASGVFVTASFDLVLSNVEMASVRPLKMALSFDFCEEASLIVEYFLFLRPDLFLVD